MRVAEFEVLSESECRELLATAEVGRIAFLDGEFPVVLPVNFVVDGNLIIIRSDIGTKSDHIPLRPVAFEVDGVERWNRSGWSVLVQGYGGDATQSLDARYDQRPDDLPDTWVPGSKPRLLTVEIQAISGRRIVATMGTSTEVQE